MGRVTSLFGLALGAGMAIVSSFNVPSASAANFSDVKFWVGSGTNEAGFVVDWNDGKAEQSLLWGYRWDGNATGEDMLRAIVAADPNLYVSISGATPFGTALFGIGYDTTGGNDFAVTPSLAFVDRTHVNPSPYDGNDGFAPANPLDHYEGGWYTGYWSYWVKADVADDWGYSGLGMTSRQLTDGAWDGWGFDDFTGTSGSPHDPTAALAPVSIPEPGTASVAVVSGAALLLLRRRKDEGHVPRGAVKGVGPLVAAAGTLAVATLAKASYVYNPADFATEVVSSTGFPANPTATQYYSAPSAVLGRPALQFKDIFGSNPNAFHRVKLIEPAYATGLQCERLITTFNAGQSVTVKMGRTVYNDPNNPFGIDLIVYGNSFFTAGGGSFVGDATNLNTTSVGGVFAESVQVSVSPDNVHWYSYPADAAHTGDGYYPTNSYLWDRTTASWTNEEADPTKPVNPAIGTAALSGKSAADVLDLYNGAAGGTGFDLAASGFDFVNYVRFDGVAGYSGGEIDAVAAVTPVPEPACLALGAAALPLIVRRRR